VQTIKSSTIPLNAHVSISQRAVTHFSTLVQPLLCYRLYRKRTCQNCNPVGPSASCSLYTWCQIFTKSATSFLPPMLMPFITAAWTPSSETYQPVRRSFLLYHLRSCWPPVWNLRHDLHNTCLGFKRDVVVCYCVYAWICHSVRRNVVLFVCKRSASAVVRYTVPFVCCLLSNAL
jgi:hypothetical protein